MPKETFWLVVLALLEVMVQVSNSYNFYLFNFYVKFNIAMLFFQTNIILIFFSTVVQYECDPGYERTGLPILLCQTDGTWSSSVPSCSRKRCFNFPEIENGFIKDKDLQYFFGDVATVECYRGYQRYYIHSFTQFKGPIIWYICTCLV